jgi:hypothetical protein
MTIDDGETITGRTIITRNQNVRNQYHPAPLRFCCIQKKKLLGRICTYREKLQLKYICWALLNPAVFQTFIVHLHFWKLGGGICLLKGFPITENKAILVRFKVFPAVVMKSTIFSDITHYIPEDGTRQNYTSLSDSRRWFS